jgi:hypothetical protein
MVYLIVDARVNQAVARPRCDGGRADTQRLSIRRRRVNPMKRFLFCAAAVLVAGIVVGSAVMGQTPRDEPADCNVTVERRVDPDLRSVYTPDDPTRAPWRPSPNPYQPGPYRPYQPPDRQKTIYAERIVLDGPACRITLDAGGTATSNSLPGIEVYSKQTGERARVYVNKSGQAMLALKARGGRCREIHRVLCELRKRGLEEGGRER